MSNTYMISLIFNGKNVSIGQYALYLKTSTINDNNVIYDSTNILAKETYVVINGIWYDANSMSINHITINITPFVWAPSFGDNSKASGSIDLSIDAVGTQNINGSIVRGNNLNKKIYIKGSFQNIFANQ